MSSCEEMFLDIQGVQTHLLKGGDGPPLVYWHGAGGAGRWYPHHALLAEHYTVYAPDHPGWGASDTDESMDTILDYVLHYDSLFRTLGIEAPVLVGHSLGGWVAADFAATYPDRLAALCLVDAAGFPFDREPVPDFFAAAARGGAEFAHLLFEKPEAAAAYFPASPTPEEGLRAYRELTSTARMVWHCWFDAKMPRRLARVNCPARVLWGAHDRLFPPALAHKIASAIPGAHLTILEGCGHMVPFEDPEALVREVLDLRKAA